MQASPIDHGHRDAFFLNGQAVRYVFALPLIRGTDIELESVGATVKAVQPGRWEPFENSAMVMEVYFLSTKGDVVTREYTMLHAFLITTIPAS